MDENKINEKLKEILINKDNNSLSITGYFVVIGLAFSLIFNFVKLYRFIFKKRKHKNNKKIEYFISKGCPYCNTIVFNTTITNCKNCGATLEYVYLRKEVDKK